MSIIFLTLDQILHAQAESIRLHASSTLQRDAFTAWVQAHVQPLS